MSIKHIMTVNNVDSFLGKIRGLIGEIEPKNLFFRTRFGIHTFGVKSAIDVIILNENYEVKEIRENLKPNRLFFWNPKYYNVLETQAGIVKKHKIKINDIFQFKIISL